MNVLMKMIEKSSHSLINHTMKYLSLGVVTRIIQSKSGLSLTPCRAGGRPPSGPGGGGANGSRLCKKGMFLYSVVRGTAQNALHLTTFQTCSFRHQLGFSGKHSSQAVITHED